MCLTLYAYMHAFLHNRSRLIQQSTRSSGVHLMIYHTLLVRVIDRIIPAARVYISVTPSRILN